MPLSVRGSADLASEVCQHAPMTLEDLSQRVGAVLALCGMGALVVAFLCAIGGEGTTPEVASLHHLFGLTLAVLALVMIAVGIALTTLVPSRASTQQHESA